MKTKRVIATTSASAAIALLNRAATLTGLTSEVDHLECGSELGVLRRSNKNGSDAIWESILLNIRTNGARVVEMEDDKDSYAYAIHVGGCHTHNVVFQIAATVINVFFHSWSKPAEKKIAILVPVVRH